MKRPYLNILLLVAAICVAAVLPSCKFGCVHGSGHHVSETRKMAGFTKLDISGDFKVNLKQDSSLTLNITADDNLLKYIKAESEDGSLHIYTKKNMCPTGAMVLNIGVKN